MQKVKPKLTSASRETAYKTKQRETSMSYYESAVGETITRHRALQELKKHGVIDFDEFFTEVGDRQEYQAQEVLVYLGY